MLVKKEKMKNMLLLKNALTTAKVLGRAVAKVDQYWGHLFKILLTNRSCVTVADEAARTYSPVEMTRGKYFKQWNIPFQKLVNMLVFQITNFMYILCVCFPFF